jgi:anti-sigma B factor antagonist
MAFVIETRQTAGATVLDISGRLTFGDPTVELRETVRRQLTEGHRKFALNLAAVSYMDSAGLGQVIATYTSVRNKGGHVVLVQPSEKTEHLLQITKLVTIFDTYDGEAEAIEALAKA